MKARLLVSWAAVTVLAGCATVTAEPIVQRSAAPSSRMGYVAGSFSVDEGGDMFRLVLADGQGREYVMPLSDTPRKGFLAEDRLGMIAVPPGNYRVTGWMTNGFAASRLSVKPTHALARPFLLQPGHVVFLGRFTARYTSRGGLMEWSITPERIRADQASSDFTEKYRTFVALPIECLLCVAPASDAVEAALPALAPR